MVVRKEALLKVLFLLVFLGFSFIIVAGARAVEIETVYQEMPTVIEEALISPRPAREDFTTEPSNGLAEVRLELALEGQKLGSLSPTNFLKYSVRLAIANGAPANTVVLILLLPLVGTIVSALYYLVGLTGFSVFMPAMISVSFLAIGVSAGLVLFTMILLLTLITGRLLRRVQLHYLARRMVTLWIVCLGTFVLFFLFSALKVFDLTKVSIFPVLFMILLSEEFVRFQFGLGRKEAVNSTAGTLLIAIVGAVLMKWGWLQEIVLLQPEISSLLILLMGFAIGRYTGFRLLEYHRFRAVLRK